VTLAVREASHVVLAVDGVEQSQTPNVEPDRIAPTAPYIL